MNAAAKVGNVSRALWWFEAGCSQTDMSLDATSCTILISAAKTSNDLDKAEAIYQEFLSTGLQPNFRILGALIGAAANARQPEKAATWLQKMKSLGLEPDHKAYASIMNAWSRAANPIKVLETLEHIKREGLEVTVVDYTMAIKSVGMAGRSVDAEHLVRDMLAEGVNLNERTLRTLERSVGTSRYQQLKRELRLDSYLDKTADQSAKRIARHSRDLAMSADTVADKAKYNREWRR